MNIKELTKEIDEITIKLGNKKYRDIISKEVISKKYNNTKQDYRIIASLLKDKYSLYGISETTIWRLLKIKDKDPAVYKEVADGKIKIKRAYNELFGVPETANKGTKIEVSAKAPAFNNLYEVLGDYLEYIKDKGKNEQPPEKLLREIDNNLFKMRKEINSLLNYYY